MESNLLSKNVSKSNILTTLPLILNIHTCTLYALQYFHRMKKMNGNLSLSKHDYMTNSSLHSVQ